MLCLGCKDGEPSHACGTWEEASPGEGVGTEILQSPPDTRHQNAAKLPKLPLALFPACWPGTSTRRYAYNGGNGERPVSGSSMTSVHASFLDKGRHTKITETEKRLKIPTQDRAKTNATRRASQC